MTEFAIDPLYFCTALCVVTGFWLFKRSGRVQARTKLAALATLATGALCFHCDSAEVVEDERGILCKRCAQLSTHALIHTSLLMTVQGPVDRRPTVDLGMLPRVDTCLTSASHSQTAETKVSEATSFTRIDPAALTPSAPLE